MGLIQFSHFSIQKYGFVSIVDIGKNAVFSQFFNYVTVKFTLLFCIKITVKIDDGYSGTDFNRSGVQKLLADAKSGKINLILCKDLSRFGRNYIEVGQYTDYIFPSFNIRFIALSDNVDTLDRNSIALEMMPIVNLVSALYGQNPK